MSLFQVGVIMLSRHNLVNIPAEDAQKKVDWTLGVSGIVAVSMAVQVIFLYRFLQQITVSVVMCIPMSTDVPHPAKVHWREVAKHDQLHCKTPRGMYVCRGTEGDAMWYGAELQI